MPKYSRERITPLCARKHRHPVQSCTILLSLQPGAPGAAFMETRCPALPANQPGTISASLMQRFASIFPA